MACVAFLTGTLGAEDLRALDLTSAPQKHEFAVSKFRRKKKKVSKLRDLHLCELMPDNAKWIFHRFPVSYLRISLSSQGEIDVEKSGQTKNVQKKIWN